ncbi:hypothetical protein E4T50_15576 [Aureobasidium sp. EXF-12298]|nr:hypothetical protein E4T50_15576 [Aureobasidium sp. EXF-12298]KAI4754356.1 hypothetical protein E4T51_12545 [Aureobasidium sp. EXF-12344]KAI4771530.1 hypothetical protein E4T52_13476 [Aureobasidium sp. EXF-3400]
MGPADEDDSSFWQNLHTLLDTQCSTHEQIDDALRDFLDVSTDGTLDTEYDIARCCYRLIDSPLFIQNKDYVRRQFVYCLLQEEHAPVLHIVTAVLLYDGRSDEAVFEMMQTEAAFPRLLDLIKGNKDDNTGLHRLLLELLCDMSRIQRLSLDDLATVDDAFVIYLFELIEELSNDANDPYHYPTIRVLLILNEQYMCYAVSPESHPTLTNRIIKVLSNHGPAYRTFGENLILLLNRESALGPQLLILKLLYLLFTTPSTFEYFYTNDLHVLVDVIIRNLLDLDPGSDDDDHDSDLPRDGGGQRALRHTYLRVLCPLLKNTQLAHDNAHYKREELRKLFYLLVNRSSFHFAPVDETVVRLVSRCKQVAWIRDESDHEDPTSPLTDTLVAKRILGMNLAEAQESSLSVLEVTAKVEKEKPMVPAPRRRKKLQQQESKETVLLRVSPVGAQKGDRSPFDDDNDEE